MSRLVVARLAVLFLAVALAMPYAASASPSHATPVRGQHLSPAPTGFLASLWGGLAHLWAAEGCAADPYGRHCAPSPASTTAVTVPPPVDAGCGIDPYGRCSAFR